MAYIWQRWLANEFRAAGLTVVEVVGWENRGRPASTGNYDPDQGLTVHHTGATSSPREPGPTLRTLIEGRPDLGGPLAPWSVRHDGVVVVIAAGRCNHAGRVGKPVPFAALGADGNAIFMGDEVDTNGTQDMPEAQRHAIAVTNAVYLEHFDQGVDVIHRHQDISDTGKWDLGSLTTPELRRDAAAARTELEDPMPTPEEIARAVWDEKLVSSGDGGKTIRAGRMLAQVHTRVGDVRTLAREIKAADPDGLAEVSLDNLEAALRTVLGSLDED